MGFAVAGARGTVKGVPDEEFDAEGAAKKLYNGMKGLGTDENALVDVFVRHSNAQRQIIKDKYKTMYGEDLIDNLKVELGGSFEKVIMALLQDPEDYLIEGVRNAIKGLGTDEYALIGLLCGRSNAELNEMKSYYSQKYGNDMEEDVADDISGDFKNFMISCMSAGRDEDDDIDLEKVKKDALDLYESGEGVLGTREEVFNAIFNQRSSKHMREVFDAYKDMTDGDEIENAIENEFSGSLKTAYLAMIKLFRNPVVFYAERLHSALKGAGTDDAALIQLLVTRSEIDLQDISEYYEMKYEETLADAVSSDTSGDYCSMLVRLVGPSASAE